MKDRLVTKQFSMNRIEKEALSSFSYKNDTPKLETAKKKKKYGKHKQPLKCTIMLLVFGPLGMLCILSVRTSLLSAHISVCHLFFFPIWSSHLFASKVALDIRLVVAFILAVLSPHILILIVNQVNKLTQLTRIQCAYCLNMSKMVWNPPKDSFFHSPHIIC